MGPVGRGSHFGGTERIERTPGSPLGLGEVLRHAGGRPGVGEERDQVEQAARVVEEARGRRDALDGDRG
jgi:hypothetical protein